MAASPSQRTLTLLRKEGFTAQVVEKKVPYSHLSQDLFGCIDILGIKAGEPVLAIQATSRANQSARYKKSIATPALRVWLATGSRFQIWGWALTGPRGKMKHWTVTRRDVTLADLPEEDKGG
jgi:hypothetical protein